MAASTANPLRERRQITDLDRASLSKKRKFFDPRTSRVSVRILPGEQYVVDNPQEVLITILGSCVAACIRDPESGIGGMNHFMMPFNETAEADQEKDALRYGNHAMETLIDALVRRGAHRAGLEIKVFGGANVTKGSINLIGDQNCDFIRHYLAHENLVCEASDLGGTHARRIQYFPDSGKVKRQFLRRLSDLQMIEEEAAYYDRISGEARPNQVRPTERGPGR